LFARTIRGQVDRADTRSATGRSRRLLGFFPLLSCVRLAQPSLFDSIVPRNFVHLMSHTHMHKGGEQVRSFKQS
jgi:hypothetical protein